MCLNAVKTKEELDKWLSTQPDVIECYKIVYRRKYKGGSRGYCPWIYSRRKFFKRNKSIRGNRKLNKTIPVQSFPFHTYVPDFHFYLNKKNAKSIACNIFGQYVFKCKIKKEDVTDIGIQGSCFCIVAKEFEFVANNFPNKTRIWY